MREETLEEKMKRTWDFLEKSSQRIDDSMLAFDKKLEKSQKAFDIKLDKMRQELREERKENKKRINKLDELFTGQWGKLIESLVEGQLIKLLKERNIVVERTFSRVEAKHNNKLYEVDIVAANGVEVVVVEVKTTLKPDDVKHFFNKLKVFKEVFPEYKDKKVYGAVAYLRKASNSTIYAEKNGLFIIKATGSGARITNEPNFKPKIF